MASFLRRTAAVALAALPLVLGRCMLSTQCDRCGNGLLIAVPAHRRLDPRRLSRDARLRRQAAELQRDPPPDGQQRRDRLSCSESLTVYLNVGDAGDSDGIAEIGVSDAPSQVTVTIALNGNTLATQSLSPSYSNEQSGGLNCGACNYGGATMSVK